MKKSQLQKLLRIHPAPWSIREGAEKIGIKGFMKGTLYAFDAKGKSIPGYQEYKGWPKNAARLRGIAEAINIAADILKKS